MIFRYLMACVAAVALTGCDSEMPIAVEGADASIVDAAIVDAQGDRGAAIDASVDAGLTWDAAVDAQPEPDAVADTGPMSDAASPDAAVPDAGPPRPPPLCDIAPRIVDDALLGPPRDLGDVPPVGQHPRVLFDAAGLAAMLERLRTTGFGAEFVRWSRGMAQNARILALADLPAAPLDAETVNVHWPSDENMSASFFVHAVHALLSEDPEQLAQAARIVANWGRVIAAHRAQNPAHRDWVEPRWELSTGWRTGGAGYALAYDVLHAHMSDPQRDLARTAIAAMTAGKRSWGMGHAPHRGFSNWYVYHGHLPVMALAIEGEEGFDAELVEQAHQVARDWLDHSIYPSGASFEDGYSTGLALREGSSAFVALSRRGENLFMHPHYRALLQHVAQMIDPYPYGLYRGHGSGDEAGYPAFYTAARYAYPDGPLTNALWRYRIGDDYRGDGVARVHYGQTIIESLAFGGDWQAGAARHPMALGFDLADCAPRRGLVVGRSDTTTDAVKLHFDARPDAMWPGHDNADRGGLIFAALGRGWLTDDNWRSFGASTDHSIVHVDGQALSAKPPSARLVEAVDTDELLVAAGDMRYAYRWQWTPPWPNPQTALMAPWEPEMSDPRDLGYPGDEAWLPASLHGHADFGFDGLFFGRQPNLPISKAFRTVALVRNAQPFALVVDDFAHEDGAMHIWSWYAHIATDLRMLPTATDDVILAPVDADDDRRLLIRVVRHGGDALQVRHERYRDAQDRADAARVIIDTQAVEPGFVTLLWPHRVGDELPQTGWMGDVLAVDGARVSITPDADGRHRVRQPAE